MRSYVPPGLAPAFVCFCGNFRVGKVTDLRGEGRKEGRERWRNSGMRLHRGQPISPDVGRATVEQVFVLLC